MTNKPMDKYTSDLLGKRQTLIYAKIEPIFPIDARSVEELLNEGDMDDFPYRIMRRRNE